MINASTSVIAELEDAVRDGSPEKRRNTLRQVTDLFLHDGERLSDDQVKVFDDVLCHLVTRVEERVKAELGEKLAKLDFAPTGVIERLAWDDAITVAGPVLTNSTRIGSDTLVEIAKAKGQDHLFAISGRKDLTEAVTDVIVERGERRVIRQLAGNTTAKFSEAGYSGMVARAEADDELTEALGLRLDLPINYLRDLLQRATDAVRAKLASIAPPELQEEIRRVLSNIAAKARGDDGPARDFSRAEGVVRRMKGLNELNDAAIKNFAEFEEVRRGCRSAGAAQQQHADRNAGQGAGRPACRPRADPLQVGQAGMARRRGDPAASPMQASHRRGNAEACRHGLYQIVGRDCRAHAAFLAASQQDRKAFIIYFHFRAPVHAGFDE